MAEPEFCMGSETDFLEIPNKWKACRIGCHCKRWGKPFTVRSVKDICVYHTF